MDRILTCHCTFVATGVNAWQEDSITLPESTEWVRFRAVRGGSTSGQPFGDIAIDDVLIENIACGATQAPTEATVETTEQVQTTTTTSTSSSTTSTTPSTPASTSTTTESSTSETTETSTTETSTTEVTAATEESSTTGTHSTTPVHGKCFTITNPIARMACFYGLLIYFVCFFKKFSFII